jgi:hypothetical protein
VAEANTPVHRLWRIFSALEPGEDRDWSLNALRRAVSDPDIPFEAAFGLVGQWRAAWRRLECETALAEMQRLETESARSFSEELHADLTRYFTAGFKNDRRRGMVPDGPRGNWYRILSACDGVPSAEWLRKLHVHPLG